MNPVLYPSRRTLVHSVPWGVEYPDFFVTICCRRMGFNQLCLQGVGDIILEAARHYQLIRRWQCELLVLMPDHLHVIVSPCGEVQLHTIIRNFKSWTAKRAGVIWQSGFFEHRLRDGPSAEQKWNYINENPVRRGLVRSPEDWPWVFTGRADRPRLAD